MWNRACPLCFTSVPRTLLLSRSDDLVCPSCKAALELSRPSLQFAGMVGLVGAFLVARRVPQPESIAAGVLPVLLGVLALGLGSALTLFFLADLVVRPKTSGGNSTHA